MRRHNKKMFYVTFVLLLFLIGIGYAVLNSSLTITGTNTIANSNWDVHFENPQATTNSTVLPTTAPSAPALSKLQSISYEVLFNTPGQVYEFTVDVVNAGSIDAMINTITSTYQIGENAAVDLTQNNPPAYLNYSVTYSDGLELAAKQKLVQGTMETLKVHVEFKSTITNEQLDAAQGESIVFTFGINYVQADGTEENIITPKDLDDDTWEQIVASAQAGTFRQYTVGSTKDVTLSIDLNNDGTPENHTYTLRVANSSMPSICSSSEYSQTACGFVLEFADVITSGPMGLEHDNGTVGTGNIGGWEHSVMRTYVNSDVYNALPSTLKNAVLETKVISGHGNTNGEVNFVTQDKMYLFSSVEVWGGTYYDTVNSSLTRQADYYYNEHVTLTSNQSFAAKKKNGSDSRWWLRTAVSDYYITYDNVYEDGTTNCNSAHHNHGVSPSFRLA